MTELDAPTTRITPVLEDGDVALAELRRAVAGPVYAPGDVEAVTELAGFNLSLAHAPVGVVGVTSAQDVAAAIRWAAARGIRVGVLATGHSDIAQRGTLVISTRRLDALHVDPATRIATVGAGVKWARVVEAAAPLELAALNGSSTDVGVVGYTLGGGIGPFIRRHGYAVDRVRRVQLVTGDATLREVTPDTDRELFDAVLGGQDVAGVVTELEFELIEAPRIYGGSVFYDGADAAAVLHAWRAWAPTLPQEMTTSVAILRVPDIEDAPPPLRGRTVTQLRVCFLGSAERGRELLAPMRAAATPEMDMVDAMSYAAIDTVHLDPPNPLPFRADGAVLREVDEATVDALLDVAGPQHDIPVVIVELRHLDGALARGTQGCVTRQDVRFLLGVVSLMVPELAAVVPAVTARILGAAAPWAAPCTPVTWVNPARGGGHPEVSWGAAERAVLEGVRRRVDPDGVCGASRIGLVG